MTDIAKLKDSDNPRYIIQNWLRNRNTIEFLGVWESLYNPSFNRVEFDAFRHQTERLAKLNAIAISQMEILIQDHRIEALEAHSGNYLLWSKNNRQDACERAKAVASIVL